MIKWFDKHFSMNRKELQGLSFLFIIVVVLWFLPSIYTALIPRKPALDLTLREREIQTFLSNVTMSESRGVDNITNERTKLNVPEPEYFSFNPNMLKAEDGKRLGLSDYQIKMIRNYVSKGGRFYKKEDFARIYSISEEDFQRLSPHIDIPATEFKKQSEERTVPENKVLLSTPKQLNKRVLSIELNQTDSIELQLLKGIGPVFASRIIRFRDLLGGFHDKEQLLKVYGMDEERYQSIQEYVFADENLIQRININKADYQQLSKHPFITSKQANVIVQFREQHGHYSKAEDLLKIAIINEEFLRKIAPYLTFAND